MKKVLATVAGLISFAMIGTACGPAVDTKEDTSTTPIAVSTIKPDRLQDDMREMKVSRGAARPEAKTTPAPKVIKPTVKPKPKVIKPKVKIVKKIYKPKKVYKKPVVRVSLSGIAACIAKYESGGNPRAQNPTSSASGLFQFIDGTWNNFKGYSRAMYAPVSIQLQKFYIVWDGGRGAGNWVVAWRCGW